MPRTAAVTLSSELLTERSVAYNKAYQAIVDAIDTDVEGELVDSAFLHPLNRARDYLGKEAGKMARMRKQLQKEAEGNAPNTPTTNGTSSEKPAETAGKK